jgi:hypothetical protein
MFCQSSPTQNSLHLGLWLSRFREREGFLQIFDNPAILRGFKEKIVPLIKAKTMEIKTMYKIFLILNEFGEFVSDLEVKDAPSKKIKEYFETKLKHQLEQFSEED